VKLQQLRYICEVARRGLNVTTAAERLFTAQSGISTQIRLLEEELDVQIFERHGKRLTGVTPTGKGIIEMAERILTEADNIRQLAQQANDDSRGTLSIATTHTQAYHALPPVIARFSKEYPGITLRIHQGDVAQIHEMLLSRTADVAITTATKNMPSELVMLPFREWNMAVITPLDHPLTREPELTLEALAQHPLITYDHSVSGRSAINQAFTDAGLLTTIALTALDADIIKKYVKLGMGVGLIAETALDETEDSRQISARLENFGALVQNIRDEAMLDELPEIIDDMQEGVQQIQHVTNDLRDFTRKDRSPQDWFDIEQCVTSALKMAQKEIPPETKITTSLKNLPKIYGSPAEINQVLMNLITNAAHAVEAVGRGKGAITIKAIERKGHILVSVMDTGQGIDEKTRGKIFEPFFTTKDVGKGTGLGLAIVRRIVTAHGGKVFIKSIMGKGTNFIFSLPVKRQPGEE